MELPILTVKPIKETPENSNQTNTITDTIYFSVDIESDGPIPGPYSMLSFGCVALNEHFNEIASMSANLELLPDASQDPDTMDFWRKNQNAYDATRINVVSPLLAMSNLNQFVTQLTDRPIFIGYPAAFDWSWINWYSHKFLNTSPFRHSSVLDIKTLAWASNRKRQNFKYFGKKSFKKSWFTGLKKDHNHIGIDDAREQGIIFGNIMKGI